MATASFAGTNYALKATPKIGTWPNAAACNGEVYCLSEECFASSTDLDAGCEMYVGKLPVGAIVLFSVIWPIISSNYYNGGVITGGAVAGELGTIADPDLFGDVTTMGTTATPQVIEPCPDGVIYTSTLDFALRAEVDVVFTSSGASWLATEGIAVKIFYTMAGQTY